MSRKPKPKEAVVLLIDVGQYVSSQDEDGTSFLQKSKTCASKIIQRKIFADASDEFNIVLVGSKRTANEFNYPNINVTNEWSRMANWSMLQTIEGLSPTEVTQADWLDGLVVAINLLKNESECKNLSKMKIIMMSNFKTPVRSQDQVDDIIDTLKELDINLAVIGVTNEENDDMIQSDEENKVEAIIARIVNETEGIMCDFDEAMAELGHFQKVVSRATPWNCDLQIGENIFIPISNYKKFASTDSLKWKKRTIEKAEIFQDTVYFEGDKQIEKADVINSYVFGQTVVPISDNDKTSMALTTEKCFQVIGFTNKQNVPLHIFLGDSAHYVAARKDCESAASAITALVIALLELEMVAIVRKVYARNFAPRVGALIPTCEHGSYFFYFVTLPFAEDERFVKLPSLKHVKPTQEQLDAIDKLIDEMDLSNLDEDEDPYNKLVNPSIEHRNHIIASKAMDPNFKIPDEPLDAVKNLLRPMPEIVEKASNTLELIKKVFCLEEVEQKNYRKVAADVFDRSIPNGGNMDVDEEEKPKDLAEELTSFVQSTVTEIGTVDPEGNFLKLLQLGENFVKLCEQMQSAIKKLFFISTTGIQKPLSALKLLRKHCVKQSPLSYNQFIASLKDDFVERGREESWNSIVTEKLGLITLEENKESSITPEEVDTFYQIKKIETPRELEFEMEAEDLLDML